MRTCKLCNVDLAEFNFERNRNHCKRCRNKKAYSGVKNKIKNKIYSLEKRIEIWVRQTLNSPNRKHLDRKFVLSLVYEALEKYPYMVFIADGVQPNSASLDRIDPSKGYEESNIRIIPMWLNMAKSNSPEEKLVPYLLDFAQRYYDFVTHFKLSLED